MQDPKKQLREYLNALILRYLNIRSLHRELDSITSWRTGPKYETYQLGSYFFSLAAYSMSRTIFVELTSILSEEEDRSLVDWLVKAKECATSVEPTRSKRGAAPDGREQIKPAEYRTIVNEQLSSIENHRKVLDHIKSRRDKAIAHMESKYFDAPAKVYEDFPLTDAEINELLEAIDEILKAQHSMIFGAALASTEVTSVHTLDTLMDYARAFQRIRRDHDLILSGFRPGDYRGHTYPKANRA